MIATSSSAAVASGAAVGSKAARACDGCLRRRARWYCAADDAFLCQSCDTSVHSANPLARRHEHLRLHPSSSPPAAGGAAANKQRERNRDEVVPAWFGRKARTQRGGHASAAKRVVGRELSRRLSVVPEAAGSGGNSPEEGRSCAGEADADEEQLLYRVPVFAEFCSPPPPLEDKTTTAAASSTYCNEDVGDMNATKPYDCWPHDYSVRVPFTQSQTRPHVRNTRVTYTIFCMHRLSLSCALNHSNYGGACSRACRGWREESSATAARNY
jgi:hypothetical protein